MKKFNEYNDKIAVAATKLFGSMPAFWVCLIWALLPLLPFLTGAKDFILYVSAGIIQLVALPLIMVGTSVLNASTERRAEEDHETIMAEMQTLKAMHEDLKEEMTEIKDLHVLIMKVLEK